MSRTPKKWAKYTDLGLFWHEVEREYEVDITVEYHNRGDTPQGYKVLATYVARPRDGSQLKRGVWAVGGEVIVKRGIDGQDAQHMLIMARLAGELQLSRAYPFWESEYYSPSRPPFG